MIQCNPFFPYHVKRINSIYTFLSKMFYFFILCINKKISLRPTIKIVAYIVKKFLS